MQPDRFRLGDQVADGEYDAVADQHPVSGALDQVFLAGDARPMHHAILGLNGGTLMSADCEV